MEEETTQEIEESEVPDIYRFPELVTVSEMKEAEQKAIESGTSAKQLMEAAGAAVADVIKEKLPAAKSAIVLAGLGANGGDGYVVARELLQHGMDVTVYSVGDYLTMKGEAKEACDEWLAEENSTGIKPIEELTDALLEATDLIVDAIFGTGLSRELSKELEKLVERVNASSSTVVAVDVPSGMDATTGQIMPVAIQAGITVTFFRAKTGHLLYPGREYSALVVLKADIGIDELLLDDIPRLRLRGSAGLALTPSSHYRYYEHKYDRGHVLVVSGGRYTTGASRLAAYGAAKSGVGLVTIAGRTNALDVHANHVTSIMLKPYNRIQDLQKMILEEMKIDAIVVGPGLGENARKITEAIIELQMPTVFDADSLSSFEDNPAMLLDNLDSEMVITPHVGEFKRLFPDLEPETDKLGAVEAATDRTEAVIVLKGADTIVSASSPRLTTINDRAPAWLATAGSGDVLAGVIGSSMAQGQRSFNAAFRGVCLHGEGGYMCGGASTATELVGGIAKAYQAVTQSMPSPWGEEDDMTSEF